jgi:hypothetical protein
VKISAILVVTGASGSGKTTTVRALEARALPGVRCYYFDAVGVPAAEALEREFGSPQSWQAVTTRAWLDRSAADPDGADVYVLEGQTRPSFVRNAVARTVLVRIVLLDCAAHARDARLAGPRGQPELSNPRMDCWAAYLRGQADALELPVIDTTNLGVDAAVDALIVHVERLRTERATAEQQAGAVRLDAGRSA